MEKIRAAVSGQKTYIIVAFVLAGVLVEKGLGIDIPGFDASQDWMAYVMAALGLGSLRAGIKKGEI